MHRRNRDDLQIPIPRFTAGCQLHRFKMQLLRHLIVTVKRKSAQQRRTQHALVHPAAAEKFYHLRYPAEILRSPAQLHRIKMIFMTVREYYPLYPG